jgi:hypothetical protein
VVIRDIEGTGKYLAVFQNGFINRYNTSQLTPENWILIIGKQFLRLMTFKNTNRAVCQDNLNSIIELVNILDLGIDQGRHTPGSSLTSVLAESGNMLYLFYDPQLMIRIIDKTTWLPIQDYVPTDCTFSIGLIPDFTNGTQFYGIWHGQNIKVFNILTTTVQIYYPFFQNITNILDVGGNIPKLIFVALIGDFFILDVTMGTIFFQGFGTLMN